MRSTACSRWHSCPSRHSRHNRHSRCIAAGGCTHQTGVMQLQECHALQMFPDTNKCTRIPLCSLFYPALPFIPTTPVFPPPLFRSSASSPRPLFRDAPSPHELTRVLPTRPARCLNPASNLPQAEPSRFSAGLSLHPHVRPAVSCSPSTEPFPSAQPAHMPHKMLCCPPFPKPLQRCSQRLPFYPLSAARRSSPLLPPRAAQLSPPPSLPLHMHSPVGYPAPLLPIPCSRACPVLSCSCEGWFQPATSDCF